MSLRNLFIEDEMAAGGVVGAAGYVGGAETAAVAGGAVSGGRSLSGSGRWSDGKTVPRPPRPAGG